MSLRAIARSLKVSSAVPAKAGMGKCIRRAEARGVSWPLPDSVDDAGLERRLFPGSRRSLFEQLDRPALRPLPTERYVFAEWKQVRVNIDYHVEVCGHDYSVPHTLVRRQLDVRLTAHTVQCLYRGQRVASHVRSPLKGRHTTADEHRPEKHRRMG